MSPSWRDRVVVCIGPQAVSAAWYARGLRASEPRRVRVECVAGGPVAALTALEQALVELELSAPQGRRVKPHAHLVLSNHFVRYALAPKVGSLRKPAERAAAASHALAAVYGDEAAAWNVVLGDAPAGDGAMAAGIEPALLAGAMARLEAAGLTAVSAEPLLSAACAPLQKTLGAQDGWIAITEPGHLLLAYVERGDWKWLRSQRLRQPLAHELPMWLDQLKVANGVTGDAQRVVLGAMQAPGFTFDAGTGYTLDPVLIEPEGRRPGVWG